MSYAYIEGPHGHIVAIWEIMNDVDQMYYTLTDHLGSITHIINEAGIIVEERSFDAWGRKRDHDTWTVEPEVSGSLTDISWDRDYTGMNIYPILALLI